MSLIFFIGCLAEMRHPPRSTTSKYFFLDPLDQKGCIKVLLRVFLKVFEHDVEFHRNDEYWKTDWFRIMFRFPFRILCVFVACHFNLPYWYVTNKEILG